MWEHLLDFLVTSAALALPAIVCASFVYERTSERPVVLLGGFAGVALAGYVAFWVWFASPEFGLAWTAVTMAAAAATIGWRRRQVLATLRDDDIWIPLLLMCLVGVLYIGLLHLYRTTLHIDILSGARYMEAMPVDNELPRRFAERLIFGNSPRRLYNEWLSSDRPPLQVGLIVFNVPIARVIGAPSVIAAHATGVWFQLLWVPAMWALLRRMGFELRQTAALTAVTAITGLTLFHSIFLWPKLGGAAFAVGAFVLYTRPQARGVRTMAGLAAFSALAWLSHGGTVFSLLALVVMGLFWRPWPSFRALAAAALVFAALALPWTAYQKWYDPPGDRLLKIHLGGVDAMDGRSAMQTIKEQYRRLGWEGAAANKKTNVITLIGGFDEYKYTLNHPRLRRVSEWYYYFRSFNVWIVALLAAPIALLRRRRTGGPTTSMIAVVFIWMAITLIDWCLVEYGPPNYVTLTHHGSFASNLAGFALAYALAWRISPWFLAALAVVSVVTSALTWIPATEKLGDAPLSRPAAAVAILSALAICGLLSYCWLTRRSGARSTSRGVH